MALTEKDINIECKTSYQLTNSKGKYDFSVLKYKINVAGYPMLYAKGKGYGKNKDATTFESISSMQEILARRKADEEFKKLQAESEKENKVKSEQVYSDEMKIWRDTVKSILARADIAKKEYEEKLKQKNIDQSKQEWYKDVGTLFDE